MRPEHAAAWPQTWLAIEPQLMYAALSRAPTDVRRLLRTLGLERRGIYVVLVYGVPRLNPAGYAPPGQN